MAESTEVSLAIIKEQLRTITESMDEAKERRKEQYQVNESVNRSIMSINNRLDNIEQSLAKSAPTIEEFITIKHKVVGAGHMGKVLWLMGGVLLSLVFSFRKGIAAWLSQG